MIAQKPKRNSQYSAHLLPDGYVMIYSVTSSWVHTLSPLGGLVWEYCDGDKTADEISALITTETNVSTKSEDVLALIKVFDENALLDSVSC